MTPDRARALLLETPSARAQCQRCYVLTFCYVEPENLWTKEPGATLCPACVQRIANRRAPGLGARPLELGL